MELVDHGHCSWAPMSSRHNEHRKRLLFPRPNGNFGQEVDVSVMEFARCTRWPAVVRCQFTRPRCSRCVPSTPPSMTHNFVAVSTAQHNGDRSHTALSVTIGNGDLSRKWGCSAASHAACAVSATRCPAEGDKTQAGSEEAVAGSVVVVRQIRGEDVACASHGRGVQPFFGSSENGVTLSLLASFGRPRTRSPMMFF